LIAQGAGLRPGSDPTHNRVDLLIGEHSARTLRKGRHWGAWHSIRRSLTNYVVIRNCEENRIRKTEGCSAAAFHAMAA
jgi:hypothetical protein